MPPLPPTLQHHIWPFLIRPLHSLHYVHLQNVPSLAMALQSDYTAAEQKLLSDAMAAFHHENAAAMAAIKQFTDPLET